MSYAIVTFDPYTYHARAFYTFNGIGPEPVPHIGAGLFVVDDLDGSVRAADDMASFHRTALYAVFAVGDCQAARAGEIPFFTHPWAAYGAPVYAPPQSADMVRAHRERVRHLLAVSAREAPSPVPVPSPEALPAAPATPAPRFEVRSGINGTNRDAWGTVAEFDNGKDAGSWVGANKARYSDAGKSLVIVKVVEQAPAVDWRAREQARLDDGTYLPLPGDWAEIIGEVYPDHFIHLASSNKLRVAFTESESSGERDKQKVLTAAEYVARYFSGNGGGPYWFSISRSAFCSTVMGDGLSPLITTLGDADEMIRVYRDTQDGPAHGCMSYSAGSYATGGIHPVTVYAKGGELAVAFLRGCVDGVRGGCDDIDPEAELMGTGKVLARCLVWIKDGENREYGRVYPDSGAASRTLRTSLEAMGFKSGNCNGAKIAKIEADYGIVMPYLDIGEGTVEDCGDYYRAGGRIAAHTTNGLLHDDDDDEICECEHCGELYDSDDMSTVYIGRRDTESWCPWCVSNSAFYCQEYEEYVDDDCIVEIVRSSGHTDTVARWVIGDCIDAVLADDGIYYEGGFTCDDCDVPFGPDELNVWDGLEETGDRAHNEGDCICNACYYARAVLVTELAQLEQDQAELPLATAA